MLDFFLTEREPGTTIAVIFGWTCLPLTIRLASTKSDNLALVQEPKNT